MDYLVYHAKDPDLCKWIIQNFKNRDIYKDNATVNDWVKQCEEILAEAE